MKYKRQPADHTSHLAEYGAFWSCYGDEKIGVPLSSEKLSTLDNSC